MKMIKLIGVMRMIGLLNPSALVRLALAIRRHGVNLLALLRFAAGTYGDREALVEDEEVRSYRQLYVETAELMTEYRERYLLGEGKKVGVIGRNHASLVRSIFAVSSTGADLHLLNTELSVAQLREILMQLELDVIICDESYKEKIDQVGVGGVKLYVSQDSIREVDDAGAAVIGREQTDRASDGRLVLGIGGKQVRIAGRFRRGTYSRLVAGSRVNQAKKARRTDRASSVKMVVQVTRARLTGRFRASSGRLVLSTGGTTGRPKQAAHRPSLFRYLDPFADFVRRLKVMDTRTVYVATPVYHGYGLAVLILSLALGKKIVLQRNFDARKACQLVREHQVDMINVVPLMLYRMLRESPDDLKPLTCIACGGAELSPKLATETLSSLGDVLFNLYGTSEAGLNFIATPQDLRAEPRTIGKPLRGVRVRILDEQDQLLPEGQIGRICVHNAWSMDGRDETWIDTGDLGYVDANGFYILCGRADSMIVSGGENVYPYEVEQIVLTHPQVEDAAAIAMKDDEFGWRLKVYVVVPDGDVVCLTEDELRDWLRERLARYQMPREIEFVNKLPYTPLGKLDRKQLQVRNDKATPSAE